MCSKSFEINVFSKSNHWETMLNNRCKKVCLVAASCVAAGVAAAADPPRTLYVMLEDPQNYRYEDRLRNAPGGKNPGDRKTFPHTTGWDIMDYDVPTQADGSHTVQLPDPTIVTQMFDKFALMVPSIPQKNLIDGKWTFPDFEIGDKASKNSPLPDFIKKAAKIKPGFKNFDKYVGVYFNDNQWLCFSWGYVRQHTNHKFERGQTEPGHHHGRRSQIYVRVTGEWLKYFLQKRFWNFEYYYYVSKVLFSLDISVKHFFVFQCGDPGNFVKQCKFTLPSGKVKTKPGCKTQTGGCVPPKGYIFYILKL